MTYQGRDARQAKCLFGSGPLISQPSCPARALMEIRGANFSSNPQTAVWTAIFSPSEAALRPSWSLAEAENRALCRR